MYAAPETFFRGYLVFLLLRFRLNDCIEFHIQKKGIERRKNRAPKMSGHHNKQEFITMPTFLPF